MSVRFVVGKTLGALGTLFFVVIFNFFLFRVVQGDPVATLFPRPQPHTLEQRDALAREFGLDGSQWDQFVAYLKQTAQLNLGRSYSSNRPVIEQIWDAAPATLWLVGLSTLLATILGILIGIVAAWRRGTWKDQSLTSSAMVTWSMPDFWLGMLLLTAFSFTLGI